MVVKQFSIKNYTRKLTSMTVVLRARLLDSKSSRFLAGVERREDWLRRDPSGSGGSGLDAAL
jgi:hypothetical protein